MNTDPIGTPTGNLTLPVNEAVRHANGGQFALMLSLIFEAQAGSFQSPAMLSTPDSVIGEYEWGRTINAALGQALQARSVAHFNLLNSIHAERQLGQLQAQGQEQSDGYQPSGRSGFRERRGRAVIDEIEQAKKYARSMHGPETERISLRTGMASI